MTRPLVKICGLKTEAALDAALKAGADMIGMVFFSPSPRHVSHQTARNLARQARNRTQIVALTVDADDDFLRDLIDAAHPDMLQLHGRETPARVAEVRQKFGLPVMKALGISTAADLAAVALYEPVADRLLFDAKPPKNSTRPGGNGLAFDWPLLKGIETSRPWILSGGLTPQNVAQAIRETGAPGVDVSSGVESAPGVKDLDKIAAFVQAARGAALTQT